MLDLHAHYVPPSLIAAARQTRLPVAYDQDANAVVFPSGPSRPIGAALTDLERRREWNEERSIDLQVLSPWMDITGDDLEGGDAAEWCRLSNDAVAEDIKGSDSFRAFASLPVSSGEAAAAELERAVTELGFVGGAVPTQVDGVDLDRAGLDPLFEAAEALQVPIFLHPFRVMAPSRMDIHFLSNVCGNPFETTVAALRLFFDGAFESWPRLKLLLAHAGGALPSLAGRAAHASNHVAGFARLASEPSEILGRFYYDSILHDPMALAFAIRALGPSRLVAGTDYPFPMKLDNPADHVKEACSVAGVNDGAVDQILVTNGRNLLGF